MSKILKSNKIVSNENIDFKYNSIYGASNKESYDYMGLNVADGFILPESSFKAIDLFIDKMKKESIWNKLTEVALLYGNSYNTITKKLKYSLGVGSPNMTSVAGDSISGYEEINGVYVGRNSYTRLATPDPALNMGFTALDMGDSWGFSFYTSTETINNIRNNLNTIMGSVFATKGTRCRVTYLTSDTFKTSSSFVSSELTSPTNNSMNGLIRFTAEKTSSTTATLKTYMKDTIISTLFATNFTESDDRNKDIWVFAENPYNSGSYYGFSGKVRFLAFDDNTLTDREHKIFNDQIEILMTALGKNFN